MNSDLVAKSLKGPKGTHVQVAIIREGQQGPLIFDLVRDEIPHPSVDLKYEIRPGRRLHSSDPVPGDHSPGS